MVELGKNNTKLAWVEKKAKFRNQPTITNKYSPNRL